MLLQIGMAGCTGDDWPLLSAFACGRDITATVTSPLENHTEAGEGGRQMSLQYCCETGLTL